MICPKCGRQMDDYHQLKKHVCHYCDDYTVHESEEKQMSEQLTPAQKNAEIVIKMAARIEELKFVVSKFEEWYCTESCPLMEFDFCPDVDGCKKAFEDDMAKQDEEDKFAFDPETDCDVVTQGKCFARYYEKLFKTLPKQGESK